MSKFDGHSEFQPDYISKMSNFSIWTVPGKVHGLSSREWTVPMKISFRLSTFPWFRSSIYGPFLFVHFHSIVHFHLYSESPKRSENRASSAFSMRLRFFNLEGWILMEPIRFDRSCLFHRGNVILTI